MQRRKRTLWLTALLGVTAVTMAACGGSTSKTPTSASSSSASSGGNLTVGELLPMSGKEAFVGQWFDHGVKAGIWDVNHNGGVMGKQMVPILQDTAGDPVDAVTAWRTLELHNPPVVFGPSSLEILGVIHYFDSAHVVDMMEGGTTVLDKMSYPYVYRVFPSDSALLAAEAYYALHTGCTRASLLYTDDANAQAEVPPILTSYGAHGGTILHNLKIVAGQSSYLSDVASAFQGNPQCVFFHADPQTASTLFANVRQLGHMNVRFITGDTGASVQLAKAMGLSYAAKYMTGIEAPASYAAANTEFLKAYQAVWHTSKPLPASPAMYDAVVIAALAMTDAHSTNPVVWRPDVTKVSNGPGTKCYTYASCLALLKQGSPINYEGASGPENFNKYHNVFSAFQVVQFDTAGNLHPVFNVSAAQLATMY